LNIAVVGLRTSRDIRDSDRVKMGRDCFQRQTLQTTLGKQMSNAVGKCVMPKRHLGRKS
jgi:hypothetical protein